MKSFILGVMFGGVMSSVGFSSIASVLDNGMRAIQQTSVNMIQEQETQSPTQLYQVRYQ